jgi:threonine synthase
VRVVSTRGGDAASLVESIAAGLARDGGLYLPERPLPIVTDEPASRSLPDVARWLLAPWFAGETLEHELDAICADAFTFDAPTYWTSERNGQLELFHGPTAAFKDFGARFLAECLARIPSPHATRTILVATSGDTGAAVAAAFHGRPGFRVVVLYPDGRVSPRQAHQLGAFGGNVATYRVAGTFDDCQRMVKAAFADASLRERAGLSSANSISLGRLLPQAAYWAKAALEARDAGRAAITVVVPTGNLGNAFAAIIAREMGLPIARIVLATNANRVLPEFLASGHYEPRATVATLANAMDVGAPSNVERLRSWWPDVADLRTFLHADSVDDKSIRARIRSTNSAQGVVVCPHTACGQEVAARLRSRGDVSPIVVAATAHPAKFADVLASIVRTRVESPPALEEILARPSSAIPMPARDDALAAALRGS